MGAIPQAKWYTDLMAQFDNLMLAHDVDASNPLHNDFRDLLVNTARDLYLQGNRSGIRWAREQANHNAQVLSESI